MKNFALGLLLGLLVGGPSAYSLGIALEDITVRDFYAAAAINGYIANGMVTLGSKDIAAQHAHELADAMMKYRHK